MQFRFSLVNIQNKIKIVNIRPKKKKRKKNQLLMKYFDLKSGRTFR